MAARIAGRQRCGALGELGDEGVGDLLVDDDALGRHADLALVDEGAEDRGVDRRVEVGVVEHDQRRLAAEFEQHRLQMLGGELGDDPADLRRAGEVDAPDGRMGDQRLDDLRRVGRRVGDDVDDALGEAGVVQHLARSADASPGRLPTTAGSTVLPQASGAAIARTPRMTGAFHGAMPSTTPAGWRIASDSTPGLSEGMTSPVICVVSAAASRSMLGGEEDS